MAADAAPIRFREHKDGEADGRVITGYAILFNTPSAVMYEDEETVVREVIAPGAVTKELLDESDIKFTMYHDRQLLLGRSNKGRGTLGYFVDEKGVGFELALPESPNGDEALSMVKRGDIAGCSFAFSTYYDDPGYVERTVEKRDGRNEITYTVKSVLGIYDFTLAADPAYPDTSVEAREFAELVTAAGRKPSQPSPAVTASVARMREIARIKI